MYIRKSERAAAAASDPRYALALQWARIKMLGPQFEFDDEGRKIRLWSGNTHIDCVTNDDVRAWLIGLRVVEDLRDGLEFVRQSYIDGMVKSDLLRKVGPHWWITRKCAERYDLPKVMGCAFPK
jgi:hypothetical protein